ncbi:hypothetical protein D9758_003885 [Tetrapyrgos nigripes]|uniref:Uncharacterized protein n=1 Tax=Tetrapyrgos nigripes TaxID=182062 RepID=A0A8H5GLN2_9AGAR|nr:hypothetical protein D9758_003885 [Tetrapyrgos nigripes]
MLKARMQANNQLHIVSMIIIFLLTTVVIVLHSVLNVHLILFNEFQFFKFEGVNEDAQFGYNAWNSTITKIYRMYLIWERQKKVALVPFIITSANHVSKSDRTERSNLKSIFNPIVFAINLLVILIVTSFNAGKIYKIHREVKTVLGSKSMQGMYNNVMAVMVGMGLAVENAQGTISTLKFTSGGPGSNTDIIA